jgi:hypothetical protein
MSFEAQLLAGKTALIAGASGGINLSIAQRLGELGASVAIVSRDQGRIDAATKSLTDSGIQAQGFAGDVRDAPAMKAIAERASAALGQFDIVVSGAAGNFFSAADEMSANAFKTVVDIDLIGTFNVLSCAFPHLRTPGASLVNISAPQAQRAMKFQAHVCAAKAGVDMLTKCLALEWGQFGVRVNAVSPGPIAETEGMKRLAADPAHTERIRAALALPRLGTKLDVANAVAFLCSEASSFITGAILDCDGGMRLGDLQSTER